MHATGCNFSYHVKRLLQQTPTVDLCMYVATKNITRGLQIDYHIPLHGHWNHTANVDVVYVTM